LTAIRACPFEAWLDADELHAVSIGTGLLFDDELAAELQGDIEPSDDKDDDIGVTTRSVQNCTLSRQGWERSPNIA
jgi:hypothetical protein